jgi:hypothetical protein
MNNIMKYQKLTELYRRDERVRDFILDFFKTRKGIRCVSFQDKTRGIHFRYGWNEQKALSGLDIENFWMRERNANGMAMFFYEYIFDPYVTDPQYNHWVYVKGSDGNVVTYSNGRKKIAILHDYYIIGSSIVFEIDAPQTKNGSGSGDKVDIFDPKYYPLFMWVKKRVEQELDRKGVIYNSLFSGNGIYIICESAFFNEIEDMNLVKFRETKHNMFEKIQPFGVRGNNPSIDTRDIGWATYYKTPFTFHETRDRMVIPISRGYINKEWLDHVTNINTEYVTSEANISDILKRCEWEKDIW